MALPNTHDGWEIFIDPKTGIRVTLSVHINVLAYQEFQAYIENTSTLGIRTTIDYQTYKTTYVADPAYEYIWKVFLREEYVQDLELTGRASIYNPNNSSKSNVVLVLARKVANATPTVNLSAPTDASTLYENTAYTISGNATDADNGNIVNIRYSINDGTARALATGISDGTTAIPFAKTLTFKNGKLFDGATAITDSLADGTAHMLRVWATDDQGATSTIISRSFYAVPNRAPSLTVDTPQPTGTINSDKFAITGTCSDIDGNDVVVTYRINSGLAKEIYRGQGAPFSFDVTLKELAVGTNDIVIEVSDTYAFKASKTVRIRKNEVKTEQLKSVARYTITPPRGTATGVVVWVQRDTGLKVDAKMSMVLDGEQEQYVEPDNPDKKTRVVSDTDVEDQFTFSSDVAKTHLTLMLELERASLEASDSIKLITGVLE